MRRRHLQFATVVAVLGLLGVVTAAVAGGGSRNVREHLTGYEEVPSVSTAATGEFRAEVRDDKIRYRISYSALDGAVTQSHIHFGQESVNGGISAFFCSNLGNGPAGTQACPPGPATVEGTIEAKDVIGPAAQGIDPGQYGELLQAIRAGVTYANVHSTKFPGGEIRAQIERGHDDH